MNRPATLDDAIRLLESEEQRYEKLWEACEESIFPTTKQRYAAKATVLWETAQKLRQLQSTGVPVEETEK